MHQSITLREAVGEYLAAFDANQPSYSLEAQLRGIVDDLAPEDSRPIAEAARAYVRACSRANRDDARDALRAALNAKPVPSRLVRAVQDWIDAPPGDRTYEAARRRDAALEGRTDAFANAVRASRDLGVFSQRRLLALWADADGNERPAPLTLAQAVQEYLTARTSNGCAGRCLEVMYTIARDLATPLAVTVRRFEAATGDDIAPALASLNAVFGVETGRLPPAHVYAKDRTNVDEAVADLDARQTNFAHAVQRNITALQARVEKIEATIAAPSAVVDWKISPIPFAAAGAVPHVSGSELLEAAARAYIAAVSVPDRNSNQRSRLIAEMRRLAASTFPLYRFVMPIIRALPGEPRLEDLRALREVLGIKQPTTPEIAADTLEAAAEAFLGARTEATTARLRAQVARANKSARARGLPLYRACYSALSRPTIPTGNDLLRLAAVLEGMKMTVEQAAQGLLEAYAPGNEDTVIRAQRRAGAACHNAQTRDALWHATERASLGCLGKPHLLEALRRALGVLSPSDSSLIDTARRAGVGTAPLNLATKALLDLGPEAVATRALLVQICVRAGERLP